MIEMQDVVILMVIVLLLFAPPRLPLLARSLRESIAQFRDRVGSGVSDGIECEGCTYTLSGREFRCPECRRLTATGSSTLISIGVAVVIFALVLLDALWF